MALKDGQKLQTGNRGRAVITKNAESMMVGPNSTLVAPSVRNGKTFVILRRGTVTVDVAKRNHRHFKLHTPNIAVVVKGTRFTMEALNKRDSVSTHRGLVGARQIGKGAEVNLPAGWSAFMNRGDRRGLLLRDPNGNVTTAAAAAAAAAAKSSQTSSASAGEGQGTGSGQGSAASENSGSGRL